MKNKLVIALLLSVVAHLPAIAQSPSENKDLINLAELDVSTIKTENDAETSIEKKGDESVLKMKFPASGSYPGVNFKSPAGKWDLSANGGISVEVTNNGSAKLGVGLRVDNPGDWKKSPWNSEVLWLAPGKTETITVHFGQSYGKPGYALDPASISNIKILVNPPKAPGEILIGKISAVGK